MKIESVYIIYSADVLSETSRFIDEMSPAFHMTAGYSGERKAEREAIAAKFDLTEGDEQYDFGYLADDGASKRYRSYQPGGNDPAGEGQHRKWAAELSYDEWLVFADCYLIDLDSSGMPERYEETMGSITEYGLIPALSVDNREGWDDNHGQVIDSTMYVSFAGEQDET